MTAPRRPARPPRVVLDTNVVVSALVFGGRLARVRHAWQRGTIVALGSATTVQELARVLAYPRFRLDPASRDELLSDYLPFVQAVTVPDALPPLPTCRDPFDLPFLRLALAGKADMLVTGDGDLLALAPRLPFAVIEPAAFIDTLPAR